MTVGELCDALQVLPRRLPVVLQIRCDTSVINAVNERVEGEIDAAFYLMTVDIAETYSQGRGWHTATFLVANEEI